MPPAITSIGIPSRKASPMPLAAWVTPAAGTIRSAPTPAPVRLTASAMNAPPPSCATSTGVIDLRRAEFVVQLGVVNARYAERVADTELFERVAREPGRGLLHAASPWSAA